MIKILRMMFFSRADQSDARQQCHSCGSGNFEIFFVPHFFLRSAPSKYSVFAFFYTFLLYVCVSPLVFRFIPLPFSFFLGGRDFFSLGGITLIRDSKINKKANTNQEGRLISTRGPTIETMSARHDKT